MAILDVPETGLSLRRGHQPGSISADPAAKPTQIMRLNLTQGTLNELVDALRSGQAARLRLGKHQVLHYGSKSQSFHSCSEPLRPEIYRAIQTDKENLYFSGVLSHSLEAQRAKEATTDTDEALANLEQSLSALERGKESRKTHMITTIHEMRALGAGDNRSATGKQAARLARMPKSKIDVEKERFFQNANRSLSTSPALGASARSPTLMPTLTLPTSAPATQSQERIRLEALRVPFLHLLAVRAVSIKYLAQQTRSSPDDCLILAQKYATENRLNREKYDLRDKAYRELDVWKFPYHSPDDRQEAIENAITAFDRMRVSRSEKLWQLLLPKEERGKGKVLSRLNLRTGPITKPSTPRVQVHPSEDPGKEGDATGNETDRTNGRLTPSAAEAIPAPKPRSTAPRKRPSEKEAATKRSPAKSKNTTLTGRVTKKSEKKTTVKSEGKFKSEEYVHDSDEDAEIVEAPAAAKLEPEKPTPVSKVGSEPAVSKSTPDEHGSATSKAGKAGSLQPQSMKTTPSSTNPLSSKTLPASSRPSNANTPCKPSPLGSSPPTNASDLDRAGRSSGQLSSSSSSPLITQVSRQTKTVRQPSLTLDARKSNGIHISVPPVTKSLKRVVPERDLPTSLQSAGRPNGHVIDPKRRRLAPSPSGSSSRSASPPLTRELQRQQLREKSQKFKQYYARYRELHDKLAAHLDPPRDELDRLGRQHDRLTRMKQEIWEEDRRLRERLSG